MIEIPNAPDPGATAEERRDFDDACRVADLQLRAEALKQAAIIQLLSTQARGNRKPATFVADVREQVDAIFAALPTSTGV